jgi:hypothetical protein
VDSKQIPQDLRSLPSFWKRDSLHEPWQFYCPLCKTTRRLPERPRPNARHYFQVALTSAVFTLVTWPWFSWKGIVSFVPMWTIFEIIYRSRMRAALSCRNCGFDPYLFLIDVQKAKAEVDAYWRKKFADAGVPFPEPLSKQKTRQPSAPSRPNP